MTSLTLDLTASLVLASNLATALQEATATHPGIPLHCSTLEGAVELPTMFTFGAEEAEVGADFWSVEPGAGEVAGMQEHLTLTPEGEDESYDDTEPFSPIKKGAEEDKSVYDDTVAFKVVEKTVEDSVYNDTVAFEAVEKTGTMKTSTTFSAVTTAFTTSLTTAATATSSTTSNTATTTQNSSLADASAAKTSLDTRADTLTATATTLTAATCLKRRARVCISSARKVIRAGQ